MLILRRYVGERVVVRCSCGQTHYVMPTSADKGVCKLGFEAPPEVEIHREEVWERIQREGKDR